MDAEGAATFRVAAAAYDRHVGRYGKELAERLCAAAAVGPGQSVLDVGCGPGALTAVLAGLVGTGRVSAVDPSEPFVEACRARVPGADVRVGAAEALPFADASFDAVLSQLVINFMTDPEAGVGEMRRVARPGATVASAVWDYGGGMTLLRTFWDAANAVDPEGRSRATRAGPCATATRVGSRASGRRPVSRPSGRVRSPSPPTTRASRISGSHSSRGVGPSAPTLGRSLAAGHPPSAARRVGRRLGSPSGAFRLTARARLATPSPRPLGSAS